MWVQFSVLISVAAILRARPSASQENPSTPREILPIESSVDAAVPTTGVGDASASASEPSTTICRDYSSCSRLARCLTSTSLHTDCGRPTDDVRARAAFLAACRFDTSRCEEFRSALESAPIIEREDGARALADICDHESSNEPFRPDYGRVPVPLDLDPSLWTAERLAAAAPHPTDACFSVAALRANAAGLAFVRRSHGRLVRACDQGRGQRSACALLQVPALDRLWAREERVERSERRERDRNSARQAAADRRAAARESGAPPSSGREGGCRECRQRVSDRCCLRETGNSECAGNYGALGGCGHEADSMCGCR